MKVPFHGLRISSILTSPSKSWPTSDHGRAGSGGYPAGRAAHAPKARGTAFQAITGLSLGARTRSWSPRIDEVHAAPQRRPAGALPPERRQQEHIVLTGAPNLYPYKGHGPACPTAQGGLCQGRRAHL